MRNKLENLKLIDDKEKLSKKEGLKKERVKDKAKGKLKSNAVSPKKGKEESFISSSKAVSLSTFKLVISQHEVMIYGELILGNLCTKSCPCNSAVEFLVAL